VVMHRLCSGGDSGSRSFRQLSHESTVCIQVCFTVYVFTCFVNGFAAFALR
jgi:hypothetical protein